MGRPVHEFRHPLTIDGNEVELRVGYVYYAGRPQVNYLRNGDPGYPAEPDEVEIVHAIDATGTDRLAALTESQVEALTEAAFEHQGECDEPADRAED